MSKVLQRENAELRQLLTELRDRIDEELELPDEDEKEEIIDDEEDAETDDD